MRDDGPASIDIEAVQGEPSQTRPKTHHHPGAIAKHHGSIPTLSFTHLARYGIVIAMLATFIAFSVLSPDSFFTLLTMKSIVRDAAPLALLAVGLSFVLVMNEFDISVGGMVALAATASILFVSTEHAGTGTIIAVILTILVGAACGLFNGFFVAYAKAPAFIFTIGMSTVYAGVSLALANSGTLYGGVPGSFMAIANSSLLGLPSAVWIALGIAIIAQAFLTRTVWGRYMYAIGGNESTASLSGIRVARLKTVGYVVVGITAALSAILLTAQVGQDNPNTGLGQLLPAYAAAFIGSSILRGRAFNAVGSAVGAVFLQMVATGLTIFNFSGPTVQIFQGAILAGAILLARISK